MSTQAISAAQQYGSDPFCRASEGFVLGTASPRHKQHATSHDHCLHRRAALRICSRACVCSFTDRCEKVNVSSRVTCTITRHDIYT